MKKNRKTKWMICTIAVLAILVISSFGVMAAPGDVAGYTQPTDIQTYVNGYGIPSYNINGFTAVAVEDLQYYGFETAWYPDMSALNIYYDENKPIPIGTIVKNNSIPNPGAKGVAYFKTDITTYINGYAVESFNIGGKTVIYLGSLNVSAGLNSDLVWLPESRTISLEIYN